MHIYKLEISSIHIIGLDQKRANIIIPKYETIRVDHHTTIRSEIIAAFVIKKIKKKKFSS
jgi:hypothetical protein